MRKLILAAIPSTLAVAIWFGYQSNSPHAADVKTAAHKLEYHREYWSDLDTGDRKTKQLNELGSEGWEMCGIVSNGPASPVVIFKRPRD